MARTPARILKHPIHPMLIVFPIGLWIFSFVLDIISMIGLGGPTLNEVSFYAILGGIIGAVLAAVPGYVDFLSLSGETRRIALWHMIVNLAALGLFIVSFAIRVGERQEITTAFVPSAIGVILLGISGWLGGELVYVHRVAVEAPAVEKPPAGEKPEEHRRLAA